MKHLPWTGFFVGPGQYVAVLWPFVYIRLDFRPPTWWLPRLHLSVARELDPPLYFVRFGWLRCAVAIGVRNGWAVLRKLNADTKDTALEVQP